MILHLSDLHFGTENKDCMEAIRQFCQTHQPEAVVVSGDLTQRAKYIEFLHCKKFLDSLETPYLTVPGNHDISLFDLWNRVFKPFTRYRLFFGNTDSVFDTEHFYLIGLNSIRRRYHTRGHISMEQIQWVSNRLAEAPADKLKIVVTHQPFYVDSQHAHAVKDCPVQGRIALESWSKNGLFALLHGHLHQSAVYDLNYIYQLNAMHPVLEIHAGTAISYRLHHGFGNSFNVIQNDGTVQYYYFDDRTKRFRTNVLDEL
ncbi:metallophosphoesterase [Acinetobacter chinensis]|uniref:Metallophosphoesterase n=1 Tax=Acinetobacter chinensis TaxID=2004650 RepID=A0ABU3WDQ0_9GAMM|nr:metallophosphoesterase [Acinetobacter chinensis]MDV2468512.1 metallophosphoesterase [Acinetobacter chinensis]